MIEIIVWIVIFDKKKKNIYRGTVMGLTRILPHLAATMVKFISNISCVPGIIAAFIILIS